MIWKCVNCGSKKKVVSGYCPECGPTQTIPLDYDAKIAAEAIEKPKHGEPIIEEAEIVEDEDE